MGGRIDRQRLLNTERMYRAIEKNGLPFCLSINSKSGYSDIVDVLAESDFDVDRVSVLAKHLRGYGRKRAEELVDAFDNEPTPEFKED